MRSAYIPIVFSFCKWTFKLRKWFSPLSQYISASSFRLAKIDHSKMSEIVASLRFLLFVFDFSFLTVLYSTKNKITHCTKKTIKKCNFKLKKNTLSYWISTIIYKISKNNGHCQWSFTRYISFTFVSQQFTTQPCGCIYYVIWQFF